MRVANSAIELRMEGFTLGYASEVRRARDKRWTGMPDTAATNSTTDVHTFANLSMRFSRLKG